MREETVTIGLSIGGRYVGVAVLKGTELRDFRVKTIRAVDEEDRLAQLRKLLEELFKKHRPSELAVKLVEEPVRSPFQSGRIDLVKTMAKERNLTITEYDIQTLKERISQSGLRSKREMAKLLATVYPVLRHALPHLADPAKFYHHKLFEAVAAARVCALKTNDTHDDTLLRSA